MIDTGGVAMSALKLIVVVAFAIFVVACAGKRKPEIVHLTPSQQALRDSPGEQRIRETAALLAEAKQEEADHKAVAKLDTPEEREVRKSLADGKKRTRKSEALRARTLGRARITGCDPATMSIHPDAVSHPTINSFVKVRVTNMDRFPVNISDAKFGPIVEGLCPGGSMTLFRNRSLDSPDFLQFNYTATGRLPDGGIGIAQSETFSLSKYDWSSGGGQQERNWFIQLYRR
ncbi:MAG: hypothetical protein EXS47_00655 [Candidatus Zambryskibacteria bacterium]|nr:hypothetical protein [Candidatus Zambryskibacteria bacterium]